MSRKNGHAPKPGIVDRLKLHPSRDPGPPPTKAVPWRVVHDTTIDGKPIEVAIVVEARTARAAYDIAVPFLAGAAFSQVHCTQVPPEGM